MGSEVNGLDPQPKLVHESAKTIAGLSKAYTMDTRSEIPRLWDQLHEQAHNLLLTRTSFGVSYRFDGQSFQYLCGMESADDLPADWDTVVLIEGQYAVFTYTGPASGIGAAMDSIWKQLIPEAQLKPDGRPSFEMYDARFDAKTSSGAVEFWIPVAP
ncbi:MAG TPA: GyrI-like domain-containing protein [Acidobacteriaceae bacterium]|jgi:AraC family transcriptional regulator